MSTKFRLRVIFMLFVTLCGLHTSPFYGGVAHAADVETPDMCQDSEKLRAKKVFRADNDILYFDNCDAPCDSSSPSSGATVSTGDGGGCGGTKDENKQQIWSFLKGKGLSDVAAAGIMGNMEQESGFMPNADNAKTMGFSDNSGRGCRGIVQWCHERNTKLDSFAAERGKSWDCLGVQLEYLWYELTETPEGAVMKDLTAATAPHDAGNIFAEQFERMKPSEQAGRDSRSEKIYEEFTGKSASPLSDQGKSAPKSCASKGGAGGPIPSANCKEVQDAFKSAVDSGRITLEIDAINKDVEHCSEQKVACNEGVRPQTLRGLIAASQNAGVDSIRLWNLNSEHGCDVYEHPKGLASDIKQANGVECSDSNPEECKKVFDYLIAHGDELGVDYVMWYGSYCDQTKSSSPSTTVYCRQDHNNHIHVSFKDS